MTETGVLVEITPRKKSRRSNELAMYLGVAVLCLGIAVCVGQFWRADLEVPFRYREDALFTGMSVKGMQDNGWYLNNPYVGAPAGLHMQDFPISDLVHLLAVKILTLFFPPLMSMNLYLLLTFPLCAVGALFVMRRLGISPPAAALTSLLYALLPFHFIRGIAHLFLSAYYMVPLAVLLALKLVLQEGFLVAPSGPRGRPRWDGLPRRLVLCLLLCLVLASSGIYYAFFSCFLVGVAGVAAAIWRRSLCPVLASGFLVAAITAGVLLNVSPTLLYQHTHGKNAVVGVRGKHEGEFYSLKMAQLILPMTGHRVPILAAVKAYYNVATPLVNENDAASLGAVGSVGFLALLAWAVFGNAGSERRRLLRALAVLNLGALLLATTGGFGPIFSFLVLSGIRCYNRISIFIGFLALLAVAVGLDAVRQRYVVSPRARLLFAALLVDLLFLGVADQSTGGPAFDPVRAEFQSDQVFVRAIEGSLPTGASVFQLPYVPFPENGRVGSMGDYDHFRAYLHSRTLHWSYGAMRGRNGDRWQHEWAAKPAPEMVAALRGAGFSGIYLNRGGYADHGEKIERELRAALPAAPMESPNRQLVFYPIRDAARRGGR